MRSVKAGDLQKGNVVWVDGYQATVLSVEQKAGGYDVRFKVSQSVPLADFHLYKWINREAEIELIR